MPTSARALGRLFNVAQALAPADTVAGAGTGNRVSLRSCETVTFIISTSAGSTDLLDFDLQEHTAASGGTSRDLDVITKCYYQSEATLDADETWVEWTQSAASEVTDIGAASEQVLVVVEVGAEQLSDDAGWVSINFPDQGTNGSKWTSCVAVTSGLRKQRKPTAMDAASV